MADLFDIKKRAMRRDRAARRGPELFLLERAFDDCLERVGMMQRRFERALLIGCVDPGWRVRLLDYAEAVDAVDPGPLFASGSDAQTVTEDQWAADEGTYDLVLAVGTLDTVNDLPLALRLTRHGLKSGGLLIGAMSGGDTLPQLRHAMHAADASGAGAAPRIHPRIEPSALAPLLVEAGFTKPVVDVDRVQVAYRSFADLVSDLRAMGTTNVLTSAGPPLNRVQRDAAVQAFAQAGDGERTIERFELLHFMGWAA